MCPPNGFKVSYSRTQGGGGQDVIVNNGQVTTTTLTGLGKWTEYDVKVAMRNELGFGPFSAVTKMRTAEEGSIRFYKVMQTIITSY